MKYFRRIYGKKGTYNFISECVLDENHRIILALDETFHSNSPYCLLLASSDKLLLPKIKMTVLEMRFSPLVYTERFLTDKIDESESLEAFLVLRIAVYLGCNRYEIV